MPVKQPARSLSSVKVRFLDASKIIKELEKVSKEIHKQNSNIRGIYLFGSLAMGTYVQGSDADTLIILKDDKRRFIDRIPEFLRYFLDAPIATDIFPYTEKEIEERFSARNSFITTLWKNKREIGSHLATRQIEKK